MLKAIFIACFLFAVCSYSKLTPSDDFNITDFVGNWNVVGFYSTENLGVTFYSCATLNVTLGTVSRLTLSLTYNNEAQDQVVQQSSTVVPSPINKAILLSTTSPIPQNNYVVVFYNATSGEAILINSAVTLGYILSRSNNPQNNNFDTLAQEVLTNNSVPTSNVTFIYNKNCEYGNLKGLTTFDPTTLAGQYYGNAVFATEPPLQDLECFTSNFELYGNFISVTSNFTFNNGDIIYDAGFLYRSLPQLISVLEDVKSRNVPPFVIIYADTTSETYVAASGDSTKAFVFSAQPTISDNILSQVQHALTQNGLIVSSTTFHTLSTICLLDDAESMIMV